MSAQCAPIFRASSLVFVDLMQGFILYLLVEAIDVYCAHVAQRESKETDYSVKRDLL